METFRAKIGGKVYNLGLVKNQTWMKQITKAVDQKITDLQALMPSASEFQILLLTCLNTMNDYYELKEASLHVEEKAIVQRDLSKTDAKPAAYEFNQTDQIEVAKADEVKADEAIIQSEITGSKLDIKKIPLKNDAKAQPAKQLKNMEMTEFVTKLPLKTSPNNPFSNYKASSFSKSIDPLTGKVKKIVHEPPKMNIEVDKNKVNKMVSILDTKSNLQQTKSNNKSSGKSVNPFK